jgi:hypothetical protein
MRLSTFCGLRRDQEQLKRKKNIDPNCSRQEWSGPASLPKSMEEVHMKKKDSNIYVMNICVTVVYEM